MHQPKFAQNGKRDIHGAEQEFDQAFDHLQSEEEWRSEENRRIVIEYVKACLLGEAKSGGRNRKVGKAWLYRVMGRLRTLSEDWLGKDFDAVTPSDWKRFYEDFEFDRITKLGGGPYAAGTKSKIYKTIRKFLKWRYGKGLAYPDFCDSWVTTEPVPTRPFLTRHEVELLIDAAGSLRVRCMVMMLFDGGFRVEELGNLRWMDIRQTEGKDYYQAHVRAETSKTKKERYVSLPLSTDLITAYRKAAEAGDAFSEEAYLFASSYQGFYKTVKRLGKKALQKNISPHILRHSSATYYANVIKTYQQFCSRYGWALNSTEAQRYFHAVLDDEVATQTKEHEIARFRNDFERVKAQNQALTNDLDELRSELAAVKDIFFQQFIETGQADQLLNEYKARKQGRRMHYKN